MNKQLTLQTDKGLKLVYAHEIRYCHAAKDSCEVHLKDNTQLSASERMCKIIQKLTSSTFFRCHHSYLVNIKCIKEYNYEKKKIILDDKLEIPLAHRRRSAFFKILNNLHKATGGGVIVRLVLHYSNKYTPVGKTTTVMDKTATLMAILYTTGII